MVRIILGSVLLALGATSMALGFINVGPISGVGLFGLVLVLGGTPLVRSGLRYIRRNEELRQRRSPGLAPPGYYSAVPRDDRIDERPDGGPSRHTARQATIAVVVSVVASVLAAVIIKALDLT
jgi:hypothetical protein